MFNRDFLSWHIYKNQKIKLIKPKILAKLLGVLEKEYSCRLQKQLAGPFLACSEDLTSFDIEVLFPNCS